MIGNFRYLISDFLRIERQQWLPYERIEELQWKRFKKILKHAYDSTEFYMTRFKSAGIEPQDIKERKDLEKIPILTREDLKSPEGLIASGFEKNTMKFSTTSGSTGRRTTTYFDKRAWLKGRVLLKLRARLACGLRPSDRLAVFSEVKGNNSILKELFLRQKFFSIFDTIEEQIPEIEEFNPSAMYGFPSYLSLLADRKTDRMNSSRVFTSSEMLDLKTREKIERAFGARVFDIYGCNEVKEIGWECEAQNGYHLNSDWLLVEFVKGRDTYMGDECTILVTSLYNYGMPLIRYELGDTCKLIKGRCSCGRGLPLISSISGRSVDYFTLPDNSMISPYAMTIALEKIDGIKKYQIIQEKKDLVTVNVVPENVYDSNAREEIKLALRSVLPGMTIGVNVVEEILREKNGKYRIVTSKVNSDRSN